MGLAKIVAVLCNADLALPQVVIVEVAIGALLVTAWRRAGKKGVVTEERENVYINALEHLTDPTSLRKLADSFEKQGLHVQANMLRRRANLRGLTPERKKIQREIYLKGMKSENVDAIERLAVEFEKLTATGAAEALRKHAYEVRQNSKVIIEKEDVGKGTKSPTPIESQEALTPEIKRDTIPIPKDIENHESENSIHQNGASLVD